MSGSTAIYTRQNPRGDRYASHASLSAYEHRYGLECPEERDYYPYWHPTPWRDIAVFTDAMSACADIRLQSQNVVPKGHCSAPQYNNMRECTAAYPRAEWMEDSAFGIDPPVCIPPLFSRPNVFSANGVRPV